MHLVMLGVDIAWNAIVWACNPEVGSSSLPRATMIFKELRRMSQLLFLFWVQQLPACLSTRRPTTNSVDLTITIEYPPRARPYATMRTTTKNEYFPLFNKWGFRSSTDGTIWFSNQLSLLVKLILTTFLKLFLQHIFRSSNSCFGIF